MKKKIVVLLQVLLLFTISLYAQVQDSIADPDSAFETARQLVFAGKREDGRELALRILKKYPNYSDVQTFVARTYAWDKNYDPARKIFADVATTHPASLDNYLAWIDAERWADADENAMLVVEKALQYFPNNSELLYRKAKLLTASGKTTDAKKILQITLQQDPKHNGAITLLQELKNEQSGNSVSAGFSYDQFSKYFSSAQYAFVQASKTIQPGSVILRMNYANRFGKNGYQPEIDLYPNISKNLYAYLNFGFSNSDVFAKKRWGAEIFSSLPHRLEASLGFRSMNFGTDNNLTIYTGSLGYYTGNYWISLRPYLTPSDGRNSISAALTTRKYFYDGDHYLSLVLRAGVSPELINIQTLPGILSKEYMNLKSQSIGIGYQQPVFCKVDAQRKY